jgi:hypothetical protein
VCDKSKTMKPRRAAALALVVCYLIMAPPLPAADDSIAVPRTADVETGLWYLMMAPTNDSAPTCNDCEVPFDRPRPLSQWRAYQAFPTKQECLDHRPGNAEDFHCVATDDTRLKGKLALIRWLFMTEPSRPVSRNGFVSTKSAPFSHWTIAKTFTTEQECLDHRKRTSDEFAHMIGTIVAKGANPDLTLHCVAVDDPRLNEK